MSEVISNLDFPFTNLKEVCHVQKLLDLRSSFIHETCQHADDAVRLDMEKELMWVIGNKVELPMDDMIVIEQKTSLYKGTKPEEPNISHDFVELKSKHVYCVRYDNERICEFVFIIGYTRFDDKKVIHDDFTMAYIKMYSLLRPRGNKREPYFYHYTVPSLLEDYDFDSSRTVFTSYTAKKITSYIRKKNRAKRAEEARIKKLTSTAEIKKDAKIYR